MGVLIEDDKCLIVSIPSVIDTSLFSNDDLQLFCESTDFIEKSRQVRGTKQKYLLNSSIQKKSEEIFEVNEIDEIEYLEIASSACSDIDVNMKNLSADIEKIFKNFNKNVSVHDRQTDKTKSRKRCQDVAKNVKRKPKIPEEDYSNKNKVICDVNKNSSPRKYETKKIPSSTPKNQSDSREFNRNEIKSIKPTAHSEKQFDVDSHDFKIPSVKAKIQFFNQLSKSVSKRTYPTLSKTFKPSINDKNIKDAYSNVQKVSIKETLAMKPSVLKCNNQNKQEDLLLQPNLVKNRIKQFESESHVKDTKEEVLIKENNMNTITVLGTNGINFVSKMRCFYDKTPKNHRENHQRHTMPHLSAERILQQGNFNRNSVVPNTNRTSQCPAKRTDTISSISYRSSSIRTEDFLHSDSLSENSSTKPTVTDNCNPFVESEKSLKKLGDIVHTIRSIREQGMTDISRDLFRKFRKSLIAANERLAESRTQTARVDCDMKMIAAVRPNVISSGTFPRILEAIPKLKGGLNTSVKVGQKSKPLRDVQYLDRDLLNESDLTYERFASILQEDQPK